ncbi:uncharacterized protein [Spinacia oleracea]|uniref:Reverse transcriptase zinc-binding domain-containing protein n=1 Tax=Spinacia oleracea TaxID=3562 RepID=A0ABM3RQL5_SPIOL|nr:uncharacterized protein LOC130471676 [Spinacia oleracea]
MYEGMSSELPKVGWCKFVWNRLTVPKHRFILWLASHDRLKTRTRLHKMGIGCDQLCPVCGNNDETVKHLFCDCTFSASCAASLLHWLGLHCTKSDMGQIMIWIRRSCKGDFRRKVAYTTMASLVYHIWRAKNTAVWDMTVPTFQTTVQRVQSDVKCRVQNLISKSVKQSDRDWFSSL